MQAFTVIVLVFGFATISLAADDKVQVCLKTTDGCESAKVLFKNLKAIQIVHPEVDVPKYIGELRELFSIALKDDCKVDVCKCKDGALDCSAIREKIHYVLQNVKLPACLDASEKAGVLLTNFKKAIAAKDREAILSGLDELKKAVETALARTDNEEMKKCIVDTIQTVRTAVRGKIEKLDVQQTCDFCTKA